MSLGIRGDATLDDHTEATARGVVLPDASFSNGPLPVKLMRLIEGPPTIAVEVRSENDDGPAAESEIRAKRADDFEAGILNVWDVDPDADVISSDRSDDPMTPTRFSQGHLADAEPAVSGWRIDVHRIFGDRG